MTEHNQLIDAINIRTTIRDYDPDPIGENRVRQLDMTIDAINTVSGLHLRLVRDHPEVFAEVNASGHFHNAYAFIAVAGPRDDVQSMEKAGFYAQRVVLAATLSGLGTGWVAGSWNRALAERCSGLGAAEALYLGITIGHPRDHRARLRNDYRELCEIQRTHRPSKSLERLTTNPDALRTAPDWFRKGVTAVAKAPSAMNRQPIIFSYDPINGRASAQITAGVASDYALVDLGIAKLHFQIGAGEGTWRWGDGGTFTRQ